MNHTNFTFAAANTLMNFITRSAQGQVASLNIATDQNFLLYIGL